jgi:hypothetical protein
MVLTWAAFRAGSSLQTGVPSVCCGPFRTMTRCGEYRPSWTPRDIERTNSATRFRWRMESKPAPGDLILYSRWNLEPLVAAPGRRVCVLYTGKQRRTYEAHLDLAGQPKR